VPAADDDRVVLVDSHSSCVEMRPCCGVVCGFLSLLTYNKRAEFGIPRMKLRWCARIFLQAVLGTAILRRG
jgi:hypothetical protein